ncbi:MAG: hypothetical protein M1819_006053 [Sarea resinae]|nr:MAG: hypothetical protein M1819_006053 [Sarea resinae]
MRAPVRSRPRPFYFRVNEDPARLDEVYTRVLGNRGSQMLTEDVKWLAVTHKSFDHGRRGFNDRLAFLGKLIVELQTSLAVIHSPSGAQASTAEPSRDQYGRTPFEHPALKGLESINKAQDIDKDQLAQLGERYGLASVIRWKPKKIDNLKGSGIETVLAQSIYAIVGAVALQKGGEVANRVVRERILMPLGVLS